MTSAGTANIRGVEFEVTTNGRNYYLHNSLLKLSGGGKTIKEAEQDVLYEAKQIKSLFYASVTNQPLKEFLDKI